MNSQELVGGPHRTAHAMLQVTHPSASTATWESDEANLSKGRTGSSWYFQHEAFLVSDRSWAGGKMRLYLDPTLPRRLVKRRYSRDMGSTTHKSRRQAKINTKNLLIKCPVCDFSTEHPIVASSKILQGYPDFSTELEDYLGLAEMGGKAWKLCYRASENNFSSHVFHLHCNYKGPTVTVVRVGQHIFGG